MRVQRASPGPAPGSLFLSVSCGFRKGLSLGLSLGTGLFCQGAVRGGIAAAPRPVEAGSSWRTRREARCRQASGPGGPSAHSWIIPLLYFCLEEYNLLICGRRYGSIKDANTEQAGWAWLCDMPRPGKSQLCFHTRRSANGSQQGRTPITLGYKGVIRQWWIISTFSSQIRAFTMCPESRAWEGPGRVLQIG